MRNAALLFFVLIVITTTACASPEPTLTPTPAPHATWTATVARSSSASSVQSSATPVPPSPSAAPTTAPTLVPSIVVPATPTPVTPGLYITNLRIDPTPALRGSDLIFYVTFMNATGKVQNFRWQVYIFKPDNPTRSYSDTAAGLSEIPVGNSEFKSAGPWRIALGGPCEDFIARPVWLDPNNKVINFTKPDGQVYEKNFRVCAPGDWPSPTPGPSPTPTATPTFAPGLFVAEIRTAPNPPTRGSDLNFIVTFVNTIGSSQNVKWNVYIFKPGEPNSTGEAAITTTTLGIGINEYKVNGFWKLPLGGPCENFVARAGWFNSENKLNWFTKFENLPYEETLRVCPP